MNKLAESEKVRLKAQHKKERDKRVCDRIKAVLLFDKGWTYSQIADALLLSKEAIRQHINEYQSCQKLKPENGGSTGKLSKDEAKRLLNHLEKHTYLYVKDIVAYAKSELQIEYSVSGMTAWLHQHGFSYKKPAVVPGKANILAQQQWIQHYQALKNNLLESETICFVDGVHPTHNTKPYYGWIRKGKRKEIPTNTGRQRLNLSGAIDILSKEVLVKEDVALNATSTIEFLKMIEKAYPLKTKVYLFCDNARYFKNKEVAAYLMGSKIEMLFLPPYSPNLNPIERLWKFMNESVLYNKYYEKFGDFKEEVFNFFINLKDPLSDLRERLLSRVTDSFQTLGLESCVLPRS